MKVPSVFAAVRAALAEDFFFSLNNSKLQRSPPFVEMVLLCVVFVALTPLFFPDVGANSLVLGTLTTFLVFWGAVVLSFLVVLLFGLNATTASVEKATFVTLSTFALAVLLFDFNLLIGLDRIEYVGMSWRPHWLVPVAYSLPYAIYCSIRGELRLRRRIQRINKLATVPARQLRLRSSIGMLRLKAALSVLVVVAFSATVMGAGVLSEKRSSFKAAVDAVTKALTYKPE